MWFQLVVQICFCFRINQTRLSLKNLLSHIHHHIAHDVCSYLRRESMRVMIDEFFLYLFAKFELHPSNSFQENQCWSHKIIQLKFSIWSVSNSTTKGIQGMQAISNLPISAWLPVADLNDGKTVAAQIRRIDIEKPHLSRSVTIPVSFSVYIFCLNFSLKYRRSWLSWPLSCKPCLPLLP